MYNQVLENTKGFDLSLRVDANGGWSTENAKYMIDWLSNKNCDYVEQPIVEGNEKELKTLREEATSVAAMIAVTGSERGKTLLRVIEDRIARLGSLRRRAHSRT